jgi:hypothetical protein
MAAAQQEADAKQRRCAGKKKKAAAAPNGMALPAQNGESDCAAINSGVLQVPMRSVSCCALDLQQADDAMHGALVLVNAQGPDCSWLLPPAVQLSRLEWLISPPPLAAAQPG